MNSTFILSLKLALKELRKGWRHFAVFLSCLVLGVAILATVNSLGSLVKDSLSREAQSLLGGDMEIRLRGMQATKEQQDFIDQYGTVSYVATLRSMLHFNDENSLIEIKAVDSHYPLLGQLTFYEPGAENVFENNGIALDPILLTQLGITIGDTVTIGDGDYTVKATIKREPDKAVQVFTFGPRVMMSQESLAASGLVSTFSLVDHRYRVLTSGVQVDDDFESKVEQALQTEFPDTSWRVTTGTDGNQSLERFLNQLISFMNLSGLATFLIAGIGIGSSVRTYLEKKSPTIAVLKVLGASNRTILQVYATSIGLLSVVGGCIGVLIALVCTSLLMPLLISIIPSVAGGAGLSLWPFLTALWYGILITYLFSIPALLSAVNIRPAVLFKSKTVFLALSTTKTTHLISAGLLILLFGTLVYNANDKVTIAGTLVAASLAFAIFALSAHLIKKLARNIQVKTPWLKMALRNIYRPGSATNTVVFATGISLTVFIALTLTEANFQARMQDIVNNRAPSLFIIDIQPHQKTAMATLLNKFAPEQDISLSPMVRGRITHLAGQPVGDVAIDDDISWAIRGDRGISYSALPPKNAEITQGEWWPEDYQGAPLLSVDDRFLKGMNLEIGDTMTVKILGEEITATISNARKIDYSTFQLNFAMLLSLGHIEDFPHTSLATIFLDEQTQAPTTLLREMAQQFPGVTAIPTREVIALIQAVMGHIATALRVCVAISLLAGLIVLTSALASALSQRMYDVAILKVLGASKGDILKSCSAEWLILAAMTFTISSILGTTAAIVINARLRGADFDYMPEYLGVLLLVSLIVVWAIGYIGNGKIFQFRPASVLRNQ